MAANSAESTRHLLSVSNQSRSHTRWRWAGLALAAASIAGQAQLPTPPPPAAPAPPTQAQPKKPLTKDEAKALLDSVDEILNFVSADTRLPIEHPVKRRLISRDETSRYLREKFNEDEGTKRLQRAEIVLKKFGLLDRDFNLRPFLISLLTEQVAGFYDNKTKTVNLLDWVEPEEQKPVLAHELTHALQDQKVDLTKWSQVSSEDIARNVEQDNAHIQTDEADTARDAVAEGQAMVTFLDYGLRPTGKTLRDAPELLDRMKDNISDTGDSPILARAPLLLQQSLLFPYNQGLAFEAAVLVKQGPQGAFADVLAHPPATSAEILHPSAYMAHEPEPVLHMPDIHPLIDPDWNPYDVGVMGEFDVHIIAELFGGKEIADALAPEWAGGVYYAAQKKSAITPEAKASTGSIGILYASEWKNEDSARSFLRVYAGQLPRKYSGLERRHADEKGDSEQVYTTSEGDVLLSNSGGGVFISEGFPLPLARKLRDSIMAAQAQGPLQVARFGPQQSPAHDPGMDLIHTIASGVVVKAALIRPFKSATSLYCETEP